MFSCWVVQLLGCWEYALSNSAPQQPNNRSAGSPGGGGFLLLLAPPAKRGAVRRALASWREIPFGLEPEGSKIVYVSR